MNAAVSEVEASFALAGLEQLIGHPGRWNYPAGTAAVLYVSCGPYAWNEFPEEHAEILRCTTGRVPTVEVHADVSGRVPGDDEVRFLADLILSRFDGVAFDDFVSLAHGWSLDEIRRNVVVEGLRFFDYVEAHRRALEGAS